MYADFVTPRIKWLDDPVLDILHSAVGLLGEVVEFLQAENEENRLEELGDIEFYTEHADQALRKLETTPIKTEVSRAEAREMEKNPEKFLLQQAALFHDRAKKLWVYEKPLAELDFASPLVRVKICLHFMAAERNLLRGDIQEQNQTKLEKRFPSGYSDSAARTRADKQGKDDDRN